MSRTLSNSPAQPIYLVRAAASVRENIVKPGVGVFAIFVRRLLTVNVIQLHFGSADSPHSLRQGNWIFIPPGLETGIYITTTGAYEADIEVVTIANGDRPVIEFHES